MTGRERIETLLSGGLADRVPLLPIAVRSAADRIAVHSRACGDAGILDTEPAA